MKVYEDFLDFMGEGRYEQELGDYLVKLHHEDVLAIYYNFTKNKETKTQGQQNTERVIKRAYKLMTGIDLLGFYDYDKEETK